MYAVIQSGGKQYRVGVGDTLKVETLPVKEGETIELDRVLMLADGQEVKVGSPFLEDMTVTATVKGHGRGRKIRVFKMRRRKNSRNQMGHRQNYTELEITAIAGTSKKTTPAKAKPKKAAAVEKTATKKAVKAKTVKKAPAKKTVKKKAAKKTS